MNSSAFIDGHNDGVGREAYHNPYSPLTNATLFAQYRKGYMAGYASGLDTTQTVTLRREQQPYKTGMSKDRVKLTLAYYYFNDPAHIQVVRKAFGLSPDDISLARKMTGYGIVDRTGLRVICRPSQFARFLILRNDAGKQNQFKELAPSLCPAHMLIDWDVDVSRNPPA